MGAPRRNLRRPQFGGFHMRLLRIDGKSHPRMAGRPDGLSALWRTDSAKGRVLHDLTPTNLRTHMATFIKTNTCIRFRSPVIAVDDLRPARPIGISRVARRDMPWPTSSFSAI